MSRSIVPKNLFTNVNLGIIYTLVSAVVILLGTTIAIQYAKGGFRFTQKGFSPETGLLNANSFPTGAEVYIDGELATATDNTLYLKPGEYLVEIRKEGFSPWKKQLKVQEELVSQTNAQLFPVAPSFSPLTLTGVTTLSTSPDGQKVLFYTDTAQTTEKNGLYLLELTNNFIPLQRTPKQIAIDSNNLNLKNASYIWSPDSTELMILDKEKHLLINIEDKINLEAEPDITWKEKQILSQWEAEIYQKEREFLKKFPEEIIEIATTSAKNVYLSPDKKRMLYTATAELTLSEDIIPPIPASNTQPEQRSLVSGGIYVYDREEDKNFQIGVETGDPATVSKILLSTDLFGAAKSLETSPSAFTNLQATNSAETAKLFQAYHTSLPINTLQWFPDSKHILFAKDQQIHIMEYDGTNNTVVYSGPFQENFVYPWPDGSKILILTSFSPDSPMNLYAVELK
ncbi:MAG: PEGA domain-containing protein [Patescibacteria group bacterium]